MCLAEEAQVDGGFGSQPRPIAPEAKPKFAKSAPTGGAKAQATAPGRTVSKELVNYTSVFAATMASEKPYVKP